MRLGSLHGRRGVSWGRLSVALRRLGAVLEPKTVRDRPETGPRSLQDRLSTASRLPKIATICPRPSQEGDMRASRCYFDLISSIVLKVFIFQYFWASPPGLRASWWHLGASWVPPGATWRVLGASLGSPWGVLGVSWNPRRSNTTLKPAQDRFKTASTWPRDCLRSPQDAPRQPKTAPRPPQD